MEREFFPLFLPRMSRWTVNLSYSTAIKYTMDKKKRKHINHSFLECKIKQVSISWSLSQKKQKFEISKVISKNLCLSWTSCSSSTPFCSSLTFESGEKNWKENEQKVIQKKMLLANFFFFFFSKRKKENSGLLL